MPLVPYLPQAFKLNFLPPFYFTYWIIILAVVAIFHEFAHGILMRRYGVKIKSTGFGFFPFFLPIFLAAFVEQDEKSMKKKKPFEQMAILSAGTFANVLIGIFFFLIMVLFFVLSFSSAGVVFTDYSYTAIPIAGISSINNFSVNNLNYEKITSLLDKDLNYINYNESYDKLNKTIEINAAYAKIAKTISTMDNIKQKDTIKNMMKNFEILYGKSDLGDSHRVNVYERLAELEDALKDKIKNL
jgi:membrane-associated protease RseP (regulator of RpoE activity)